MHNLNYFSEGTGQPILFLHGFPDYSYSWRHQIKAFSKTNQVIVPDLLGYNLSAKPLGLDAYTLSSLVHCVVNFINKLNLSNIILVGHDWGGLIAWTLASYYPKYFEKLIIINAPHPIILKNLLSSNEAQQKASEYIKLFLSSKACEMLRQNNYFLLKETFINKGLKKGFITPEDVEQYESAWSQPLALECMLNYYKASFFIDKNQHLVFNHGLEDMKPLHVPTRVIWGEWDKALLIENLDGLHDWVEELEIIRIPEKTHWIIHEDSNAINQFLKEFID